MAINFDSLPTEKPQGSLYEKGFYKGTIVKAEMRTPRNGNQDYLSITYDVTNKDGSAKGKFWDNLFDTDKDIPRYKLGRFINALGLELTGTFELKDLAKIVVGKTLVIDMGLNEKGDRPQNEVEIFKNEIFYPLREWASLVGVPEDFTTDLAEEDSPFTAEDAQDSDTPSEEMSTEEDSY